MSSLESEPSKDPLGPKSSFLPGGIPLPGRYARFEGRLYECREVKPAFENAPVTQLILISATENPGSGWQLTRPYPGSSTTEWTRIIERSEANETFQCAGSATWSGITMFNLEYLPDENLIGGYMDSAVNRLEDDRYISVRLYQIEQHLFFGYVPLDELEGLRLSHVKWPEDPKRSKKKLRRLFR
ncbi:hypothetical protein [Glutamicibacter sp. JC586]|uniref:hypothetical protein n=1 Tax=Glutamicibacter sp. JC586 TaxID=2590552 RepID=UPI001359B9FF|nr:hypothetical protein [Glutamicibacter sp. JC586]